MTSSDKMSSDTRTHQSLRAHAVPKQPLLECEQCYYQHKNHHPCLFCTGCLKTTAGKPKNSALNKNGYHGNKNDPDGSRSHQDEQLEQIKSRRQNTEFWDTFMELKTSQKKRPGTESNERTTNQRISIMKQKAKKLEKRATRCGFCPKDAKRMTLVSYCVHCKKHLCGVCSNAHAADPLCKHHGTVDLSKDKNTALL